MSRDYVSQHQGFAGLHDIGSPRYLFLKASRQVASGLFRELDVPIPVWSRRGGGFPVPHALVGDLLAAASVQHVVVQLAKAAAAVDRGAT